mgnify:CR=1 FL=1
MGKGGTKEVQDILRNLYPATKRVWMSEGLSPTDQFAARMLKGEFSNMTLSTDDQNNVIFTVGVQAFNSWHQDHNSVVPWADTVNFIYKHLQSSRGAFANAANGISDNCRSGSQNQALFFHAG